MPMKNKTETNETFAKVLKHFPSKRAMADAYGVKPPALTKWETNGIPYLRSKQTEELTNGKVTRAEIESPYFH